MGIETKSGFLGLVTNTADLQAPPGALERARNVVIRRAGAIEPRPGVVAWTTLANTQQTIKIIPYESETVLANKTASYEWWDVLTNTSITYTLPDASVISPATFRDDLIPHAQTRGNLYVGTSRGVMKWTGGGTEFQTTGVIPAAVITSSVVPAGTILPNNNKFAYRIVHKRTDSNGLVIRSIPSGYYTVLNISGVTANVTLSLYVQSDRLAWFDELEIYRSRAFPTAIQFDEEYALVGVVQASSFAGAPIATVTYADTTLDANRGATLYTSPSREGSEGANERPHACGTQAVFKGAQFTGNTISPARKVVSYIYGGNRTGFATGIGVRIATGDTASGSAVLTNVTPTTGVQVGMVVTSSVAGVIAPGSRVLSIVGTTVTLSSAVLIGPLFAVNLVFTDAVELDGIWYAISGVSGGAAVSNVTLEDVLAVGGSQGVGTAQTPSEIFYAYDVTPPVTGFTNTTVIEEMIVSPLSTRTIRATHGDEFSPALPLAGAAAANLDRDTDKYMLRWSKPDEPEHFPPANFSRVGDKKRAILGLVATRDALYIFKEDGVWRLTGSDGQYRIDPFDLTTHCVLPSSIAPLKNRIFMLSNRGVVAVSDEGVEVVSSAIEESLRPVIYGLQVAGAGSGYFLSNVGYAGTAVDRDNEYMLFVGNALSGSVSGISNGGIVYNDVTRAWTSFEFSSTAGANICMPSTWAFQDRVGVVRIAQRAGVGASITAFLQLAEPGRASPFLSLPYSCDGYQAITVTVAGPNITYTPATQFAVGEYIVTATTAYRITAVTDTTHVTVDDAIPTGAAYGVRSISIRVAPRAWMAPHQVMKHWTQFVAEFSYLVGAVSLSSFSDSSLNAAGAATLTSTPFDFALRTPQQTTWYARGAALRSWFPAVSARGFRLYADLNWAQIAGNAVLESLFVQTVDGKTNAPNLEIKP